mmetsp:Transcript_116378/g.290624  ORF Transcript_116378/g.290624 Transcript_116378/m.290624 type:complete len:226 (-) Transcript_116378:23-700(-)
MRETRLRIVASKSLEKARNCSSRLVRSAWIVFSRLAMRASIISRVRRSAASSPSRRATSARRPWSFSGPACPLSPHSSRRRRWRTATSSSIHAIRRSSPNCCFEDDVPLTLVLRSLGLEGLGSPPVRSILESESGEFCTAAVAARVTLPNTRVGEEPLTAPLPSLPVVCHGMRVEPGGSLPAREPVSELAAALPVPCLGGEAIRWPVMCAMAACPRKIPVALRDS